MPIRALATLLLTLLALPAPAADPPTFSITDYDAAPDGKTLNTKAIAKAIDEASNAGGGVVRVPKGKWLTGAVVLKSNVTLHLEKDAILLMTTEPADYPVVRTRWEGIECYNYAGLISARDATKIAITGSGTIDGQGQAWWRWAKSAGPAIRRLRELGETTGDAKDRIFGTVKDALRPSLVQFVNCKDVRVEGVNLRNSPMWTLHPVYCEGVVFRDVYIFGQGPNTDGIDPDSCTNVLIERCTIDCAEDCVAIKSGRDKDGRRVGRACEDVTVKDCTFLRGQAAVAIGSETSGGVRNVTVTNSKVNNTQRGLRIKTMRGRGGVIENVTFAGATMTNAGQLAVEIDLQYNPSEPQAFDDATTPVVRGVTVAHVNCDGPRRAIRVRGLEESPVEGLTIRNMKVVNAEKGAALEHVVKATIDNLLVDAKEGPTVLGDRLADCTVNYFRTTKPPKDGPVLEFKDSPNVTVKNSAAPRETNIFVRLTGSKSTGFQLVDCDTSKARHAMKAEGGAPK